MNLWKHYYNLQQDAQVTFLNRNLMFRAKKRKAERFRVVCIIISSLLALGLVAANIWFNVRGKKWLL
jgi:hypothetical protein